MSEKGPISSTIWKLCFILKVPYFTGLVFDFDPNPRFKTHRLSCYWVDSHTQRNQILQVLDGLYITTIDP